MAKLISPRPSVLVVDDEPEARELMAEILEREGYKVAVAVNGQQALQSIQKVMPDLILLDLNMPVMNGRQFMSRLEQLPARATASVIVITAQEPRTLPGAAAILRKPIDVRMLLGLLRQLINDRLS
jgi:two-component system chemotaxis response regulator CheY